MPEIVETLEDIFRYYVIGVLRYKPTCRCFIGCGREGRRWAWLEVSTVAFEIFCEKLLEFEEDGDVTIEGPPDNLLILQSKYPGLQYRAKFFLSEVREKVDPWDTDLLKAA